MNKMTTSPLIRSDMKKNQEQGPQGAGNKDQTALDGHVILKVLKLNFTVKPAYDDEFRHYAEELVAFTHENIIKVHRYDYNSSQIFMMMEEVDKQEYRTLNDYLQEQTYEIQEALPLLRQLASALDMAHAGGILHRTLQANCIFINQDGELKVSDFGIANLIESLGGSVFQLAPPEVLLYMSPEQAKAKGEVGAAAADIYSLGVITYQMLAGQLPPLHERLEEEATTLAAKGISPRLMKVLRRGMATEPAHRYPTASAFVEALEKANQANQQDASLFVEFPNRRRRSKPFSEQQKSKRKFTLALLAIVLLGALGVGLFFSGGITSESPQESLVEATTVVETEEIATPRETSPSSPISTTIGTDGMVLVYVPAGKFMMGSEAIDEQPAHEVTLDAYWIDQTEVTTEMYATCVAEDACTPPVLENSAIEAAYYEAQRYHHYPIINISWAQANSYCKWAGRRLPTEAEWEKAARGVEGYIYPWSNEVIEEQLAKHLNYCDKNCSEQWRDDKIDDGYAKTAPVDSYPAGASPYGALNMGGNVSEWVADWYDEGEERVLRGSSWFLDLAHARTTKRRGFAPTVIFDHVGFRCAREP